jgi:hypothetical protein
MRQGMELRQLIGTLPSLSPRGWPTTNASLWDGAGGRRNHAGGETVKLGRMQSFES